MQIYNDGYWPICGGKHPHSMGQDFTECWASAWPAIGEALVHARGGVTSYLENQRMFLDRNDYLEETFFTFPFSPIRDESGSVGGLFHPVTESKSFRMPSNTYAHAIQPLLRSASPSLTTNLSIACAPTASASIAKLFTAFQRFHRPQDFEGSGIGLATVQRIIARDNGRIWADAEVGKGSTFSFTLGNSDKSVLSGT